jgi:hypothetical protein
MRNAPRLSQPLRRTLLPPVVRRPGRSWYIPAPSRSRLRLTRSLPGLPGAGFRQQPKARTTLQACPQAAIRSASLAARSRPTFRQSSMIPIHRSASRLPLPTCVLPPMQVDSSPRRRREAKRRFLMHSYCRSMLPSPMPILPMEAPIRLQHRLSACTRCA